MKLAGVWLLICAAYMGIMTAIDKFIEHRHPEIIEEPIDTEQQ